MKYSTVLRVRTEPDLPSATRVNDAAKEARRAGDSQALSRLTSLRGGIENAISDTIERRAAQEADAVARGELSPEETIVARTEAWRLDRQASQVAGAGSLGVGSEGTPAQAFRDPGPFGAASQAGVGPVDGPRYPRVSGNAGGGRTASTGRAGRQSAPLSLNEFNRISMKRHGSASGGRLRPRASVSVCSTKGRSARRCGRSAIATTMRFRKLRCRASSSDRATRVLMRWRCSGARSAMMRKPLMRSRTSADGQPLPMAAGMGR